MKSTDSDVSVFLKFRAMSAPIAVCIPQHVLRYLESYAERTALPDGRIMYGQPDGMLPLLQRTAALSAEAAYI